MFVFFQKSPFNHPRAVQSADAPNCPRDGPHALLGGRDLAVAGRMRWFFCGHFQDARSRPAPIHRPQAGAKTPVREVSNTKARAFEKRSFT